MTHPTGYLEGLMVGLQQNQARTEVWLQKFEENHKKEMDEITRRMDAVEERLTHDRATRAAWNQLIGALVTFITIAITFFSGAFNHWLGKGG
jgi:hypothetical protein